MYTLTGVRRGMAILFLVLLAWASVTRSADAASIYGSDDFSTGISATRWPLNLTNHGRMTVAGTNGHASFLVPGAATDEQNAYLVWAGRPRADADWSAEVRGHNAAAASVYGGSSLQLGVGEARLLTGGEGSSFNVEFSRQNRSGLAAAEFQYWASTGPDEPIERIPSALSVTDFRLRIIFRAAMQRFEVWYEDTGLGRNWKLLRSSPLTEVVPGATPATEFAVALLANTYHGPVTEGQLWADDFRLVNGLLEVPVLTTQPAGQTVVSGNTVSLGVAATGTGLTYQWRKDGVDIPGATGSSYTVANAQPSHSGSYTVVVSNANGGVTSNAATLTVQNGSIYGSDDFSTGISATRWPINLTNHGTMTVAGTGGRASFLVPGASTDEQNAYLVWAGRPRADADWSAEVRGHNSAPASVFGGSSLQLGVGEARILTDGEGYSFNVEFSRHNRSGVEEADFQYWASSGPDEPIERIPSPLSVTDFRLRIIFRGATQRFEVWYEDTGQGTNWKLLRSSPLSEVVPGATPAGEFAVALLANTYYGPVTEGQLWADDFRLVNGLLEVPVLTTQPAGQTVVAGNPVTLTVAATGKDLTYQWRRDGVNIPGATGRTHTLASAQPSHAGSYTVVVSNANGGVTSGGANLAVTKATPVIFTAPTATAITVGQMLSSSVLSGGSASVAGIFSFSAPATVPGAGVTLQPVTFTPTDSAKYTAATTSVSVTANPPLSPPAITSQPASLTLTVGALASFSVIATGTEPLRYQWRKNGVNIVGGTGATYSVAAALTADAGSYSLVVSNAAGSVTSSSASLTVNKATPVVLRAPTAAPITAGQRLSSSVLSGGSASVAGIFTFSAPATVPSAGTGPHPVTFTPGDSANYTTGSTTVSVTVNPVVSPPSISVQPAPLTVNAGSRATFRVTATGATALGYQWRKGGVPVGGATGEAYAIDAVEAFHAGSYDVVVTDTYGNSVTSDAQRLAVNLPASIASQPPQSISATIGASVALKVVAGGTGPFTYQWQLNGVALAGGTSATYLAQTSEVGAAQYSVKVTSQSYGNTVESERTTLTVLLGRAISILRAPSPETTVIRGTGAVLKVTADPNPSDALRTTYRLLSYVNNAAGVDAGIGGTVPAGGEVEVPLKGLIAGGSYAVVFSREYADGQVISGVKTAPFAVTLRTFEEAAGTYELLLGDANGLVGDGANYRGVVLVTVSKTGAVSGRVLYNEAAALPDASGLERAYTAVARAFSGAFTPSAADSDKLVSSPRLGLGAQANRQALELELDFSAIPVVLNASVRDRISVPPEVDEEGCVSNGFGAVRVVTKLSEVALGSVKADLGLLVGRYALGSDSGAMHGSGPGADNNGTLLAQVLATGKVLWATRLSGFTGSGSATLSTGDRDEATAQFYQSRTLSTTNALSTNSLLGKLCFKRLAGGTLWSAGVAVGDGDDKLEKQSCYITKSGKVPVFDAERFDLGGVGSPSFNWSGVQLLDFQFGATCRWTGSTAAGLLEFFKPAGAGLAGGIPPLYLTAEDPAGEGPYVWTIAVSSGGIVKATSTSGAGMQPTLTLRLDKARGEWVGSYVSPLTKLRRTMAGVVARPGGEDLLRGAGWVELGAIPSTQTSGWRLELASP
jgi:hypothetical protein